MASRFSRAALRQAPCIIQVVAFDPSQAGSASLVYSTYLGGGGGDYTGGFCGVGGDQVHGIAVDSKSNAYVTARPAPRIPRLPTEHFRPPTRLSTPARSAARTPFCPS